ncbi:hypothetical protein BU17DRAFT_82485 [Hysterangium stoloniferum]|nr:hypothetical protein BU17DRAFT_82485 [Hysterangium stoloniferum]
MPDVLPAEIYRRIVEHLYPVHDTKHLAAIARSSRLLHNIAEPYLYSMLYLVGPRHLQDMLKNYVDRPLLSTFIHHLYIRATDRDRIPPSYWTDVSELLKRCAASLELLVIMAADNEACYFSWVLRSLHGATGNLTILRVPFGWDTEATAYLESPGARGLSRIETADIPGSVSLTPNQVPGTLTLRNDAAPHLTVIEAPPSAVCLLVPGRPVTHVRFKFGLSTTLHSFPSANHLVGRCLVRSTAAKGLLAFDMGDLTHAQHSETYSLDVMELSARFLPNLKYIGAVNFPFAKDVPVTRLYQPLLRLTELENIELVISHLHPPVDPYWELSTCCDLRVYSHALRDITFLKGNYDRHRWVWSDEEEDFVMIAQMGMLPDWGGV